MAKEFFDERKEKGDFLIKDEGEKSYSSSAIFLKVHKSKGRTLFVVYV
jgi:hypothetical protein